MSAVDDLLFDLRETISGSNAVLLSLVDAPGVTRERSRRIQRQVERNAEFFKRIDEWVGADEIRRRVGIADHNRYLALKEARERVDAK